MRIRRSDGLPKALPDPVNYEFGARLDVEGRSDNVEWELVCSFAGGLLMKLSKHILCLLVLLLLGVPQVQGQKKRRSPPPQKYQLELVYIFDANPAEYIFLVGNVDISLSPP